VLDFEPFHDSTVHRSSLFVLFQKSIDTCVVHIRSGISRLIRSWVWVLLAFPLLLLGCEEDEGLFNPNREEGTPPTIESIAPSDSAEADSQITIQGSNFVSNPEANYVYFGSNEGEIQSASPSEITVITPEVTGTFDVQAATRKAEDFSNTVEGYKLY
jgi:hypothetical protein